MLNQLQWRNEWRLQSRNPLVWIALAITAGFSLIIADGSPADPGTPAVAALLRINLFIPAFILPFLAGALGPLYYLRESDHGMAELFGAYPITLRQWLLMRLGNFTLLLAGACLIAQLGFVAVLADEHPGHVSSMVGHSALWLMVLHLPSCLVWASALAWVACRKGGSGFLYAAAAIGWIAYLAIASLIGLPLIAGSEVVFPKLWQAMLVLDPYGATTMISAMPQSGPLHSREVNVAVSRVLWLAICFLLLRGIRDRPNQAEQDTKASGPIARAVGYMSQFRIRWFDYGGYSSLALHLRYVLRDRIFVLMVAGWTAIILPEAFAGPDYAEELSRVLPDSRDALNRVMWDVVPIAGALLLLYAADRVCRMYPATRMHELYAATPHRPARLMAVQVASLWCIAAFFLAVGGISVVIAQWLNGSVIQPIEFVLQLGYSLPAWLLMGAAFAALHALVRLRFVANLACLLLAVLGFTSLAPRLGLEHPLWRPLFSPLSAPDHYWGFEGSLSGHTQYLLFWVPACVAVACLATASHHRTLPFRQTSLRRVMRDPVALLAAALVGLAAWQGSLIDRELRNEGLLVSSEARAKQRADYERRYAVWLQRPQPEIEHIGAEVDFRPREGRVGVRARLRLVNRTAGSITEILVGRNRIDQDSNITLGKASILRQDVELGQTIYRLHRPLAPGGTVDLDFGTVLTQSGIEAASFPFVLRPSFSSVPVHAILPVIGFRRELTLRDPLTRQQQGLPPLTLLPPSALPSPPTGSLLSDLVKLDAIVTTDSDLHVVAQGDRISRWQRQGRSYFQYRTGGPIRNLPVFYAVPWKPQVWSAGPLKIETYSPEGLRDDNPNLQAMRDTLAWLGHDIAPYPGNTLRLVAIPDIGPSGYAYPQIMEISHRLGFRAHPEPGAGFSQVYRRAAHETAHQWFGHLLGHGIPEERGFLVESLAKYAELVMIERRFGKGAVQALVQFEWDRYRQARLDLDEPGAPLIDAEASEDMYSRATLVFACARSKLGDQPVIEALRHMAVRSNATQTPARSIEFVRAMTANVAPSLRKPVAALFLSSIPLEDQLARLGCARE